MQPSKIQKPTQTQILNNVRYSFEIENIYIEHERAQRLYDKVLTRFKSSKK